MSARKPACQPKMPSKSEAEQFNETVDAAYGDMIIAMSVLELFEACLKTSVAAIHMEFALQGVFATFRSASTSLGQGRDVRAVTVSGATSE